MEYSTLIQELDHLNNVSYIIDDNHNFSNEPLYFIKSNNGIFELHHRKDGLICEGSSGSLCSNIRNIIGEKLSKHIKENNQEVFYIIRNKIGVFDLNLRITKLEDCIDRLEKTFGTLINAIRK